MNKRLTLFNRVGLLFFYVYKDMGNERRSVSFGNGDRVIGNARASGCPISCTAILLYCGVIHHFTVYKANTSGEADVCSKAASLAELGF